MPEGSRKVTVAAISWTLVAAALASTGCLEDPGHPALSGIVADESTAQVALAWLPLSVELPMTPGVPVPIGEDGTFDPVELLPASAEEPPAYTCEEGRTIAGVDCGPDGPDETGARIGLARILGFAGDPSQPIEAYPPYRESLSVCDDIEVVWASAPVVRGTREWFAYQAELPQGASLVRRVRCPITINPCAVCLPVFDVPHCLEPISAEELVVVRAWQGDDGEHRP